MIIAHVSAESEVLETFTAPDPWHGGRPCTFRVRHDHAGGWVPAHAAIDKRSRWQSFVLCAGQDTEGRRLPDALASLWLQGDVPAASLPQLLAGLEPQLKASDFVAHHALNPMQRAIRRWAPMFLAALLVWMGVSMWNSDTTIALVMLGSGVLVGAGSWLAGGHFSTRRRQQQAWALAQLKRT